MRSWHFDSQAIESGDTTTYDRAYGSAEEREERKMLVGNGIYANPATNMQVVADNGMTVKVKPGRAGLKGLLVSLITMKARHLPQAKMGVLI